MEALMASSSCVGVFSSVLDVPATQKQSKFSVISVSTASVQSSPLGISWSSRKSAICNAKNRSVSVFPFSTNRIGRKLSVASVDDAQAEISEPEAAPEEELEYIGDDNLTIYFKAEGFLTEDLKPEVIKALEAVEGVSNVTVAVSEGTATAECTQATSVQATGMAAALVEAIQSAGFQLNTIHLGFDDEMEADQTYFSFNNMRLGDDEGAPKAL